MWVSEKKKISWPLKFGLTRSKRQKGLENAQKKSKNSLCGFIQRRPVAHLQGRALRTVQFSQKEGVTRPNRAKVVHHQSKKA